MTYFCKNEDCEAQLYEIKDGGQKCMSCKTIVQNIEDMVIGQDDEPEDNIQEEENKSEDGNSNTKLNKKKPLNTIHKKASQDSNDEYPGMFGFEKTEVQKKQLCKCSNNESYDQTINQDEINLKCQCGYNKSIDKGEQSLWFKQIKDKETQKLYQNEDNTSNENKDQNINNSSNHEEINEDLLKRPRIDKNDLNQNLSKSETNKEKIKKLVHKKGQLEEKRIYDYLKSKDIKIDLNDYDKSIFKNVCEGQLIFTKNTQVQRSPKCDKQCLTNHKQAKEKIKGFNKEPLGKMIGNDPCWKCIKIFRRENIIQKYEF